MSKGKTKVAVFADLAGTKARILHIIAMAAGDAVATQLIKSAWRACEALAKAQNEVIAKGLDPDKRQRWEPRQENAWTMR